MKVFRGVLIRGRVAAADMPAGQAQSQVDLLAPGAQTVFTALRAGGDFMNLIQVPTFLTHRFLPLEFDRVIRNRRPQTVVSGNRT
jgi:hypothetical protein